MPIVSHSIEKGAVQKDSRLAIVERYYRADGSEVMYVSSVDSDTDLGAHASRRIEEIETADAGVVESDPVVAKLDDIKNRYISGDIAEAKAAGEEASRQMIEADKAAAAARDERIKADGVIADALGKQAALAEREIALDNRETSLASRERLQIEAAEKADESMRIREQMVEQASKTVAARAEALQAKEAEIDGMRQDLAARLERIRQAAGG